jgi:hypothetical protein
MVPPKLALLPLRVLLLTVACAMPLVEPMLKMPPPWKALLPLRVQLLTVNVPSALKMQPE